MGDIDKRAQTLQALSEYITAHRLLLSKTQADIERLHELKNRVVSQPSGFVENLSEELKDTTFRLSEQVECFSEICKPKDIDWTVYEKHDPTPFRSFTLPIPTTQCLPPLLPPTQPLKSLSQPSQCHPPNPNPIPNPIPYPNVTPPLSLSYPHPLRDYVRTARTTILDPIFTKFNLSYNPEPEPEPESERKDVNGKKTREQEHQKIRDLKKRKIVCGGLTVSGNGSPSSSARGPRGVFVRKDVQDESMEVDVDANDAAANSLPVTGSLEEEKKEDVGPQRVTRQWNFSKSKTKGKPKPVPPRRGERRVVSLVPPLPMVLTKAPRIRRPSMKASLDDEEGEMEIEKERKQGVEEEKKEEKDKPQARLKGPTIIIPPPCHPRRMRVTSTSTESSMTPPVFRDTRSRSRSQSYSRSRYSPARSSPVTSPEPEVQEEIDNDEMEMEDITAGGEDEDYAMAAMEVDPLGGGEGKKKPKPETYKQAWSVSEQHLLERLLDEIPDGSKNRWKQISLGMGGRRTPRQVASRVQKYFEKLRKYDAFDVDVV